MRATAIATTLALCACSSPSQPLVAPLTIEVTDEGGRPAAGALARIDGRDAGVTGADGRLRGSVIGPEGRAARVEVICPAGSRAREAGSRELTVRLLRAVPSGEHDGDLPLAPLRCGFVCASKQREHVLVVKTDRRAGLPVILQGRRVAVTDERGVAQLTLAGAAGEEIEVRLDTTTRPALRPSAPVRRFRLPEGSQILLFDQEFEEGRRVKRRRPRRARRPTRL